MAYLFVQFHSRAIRWRSSHRHRSQDLQLFENMDEIQPEQLRLSATPNRNIYSHVSLSQSINEPFVIIQNLRGLNPQHEDER